MTMISLAFAAGVIVVVDVIVIAVVIVVLHSTPSITSTLPMYHAMSLGTYVRPYHGSSPNKYIYSCLMYR